MSLLVLLVAFHCIVTPLSTFAFQVYSPLTSTSSNKVTSVSTTISTPGYHLPLSCSTSTSATTSALHQKYNKCLVLQAKADDDDDDDDDVDDEEEKVVNPYNDPNYPDVSVLLVYYLN